MPFIDEKFMSNKLRYVLQCLLATLAVCVILFILDAIANAAVIASLGASAFIAFTMPWANVSKPKFLIGGYIIGSLTGVLCFWISTMPTLQDIAFIQAYDTIIFSALAVGLAMFIMVVTDMEHPPAAGVALGLVLNGCTVRTVVVVLVGIISLSIIKTILKPFLRDLL